MFNSRCGHMFIILTRDGNNKCVNTTKAQLKCFTSTQTERIQQLNTDRKKMSERKRILKFQKKPILKKNTFFNPQSNSNMIVLQKSFGKQMRVKKYFKLLQRFFLRMPFNKTTKQKSASYLTHLVLYFFLTHDLQFFIKKIVTFLQNSPRRFQFKLIRFLNLLNQSHFKNLFNCFFISGLYFKISGKFGGMGGSKKLRKKIVWFKPKFSDRNLKIERSVQYVWSFSGTTTWSVYALYKLCLILT